MKETYTIAFPARVTMNLTFSVEAGSKEEADKIAQGILHGDFINYEDPDSTMLPDWSTPSLLDGKATLTAGFRDIEVIETHAEA
jgi:hypothetical protein